MLALSLGLTAALCWGLHDLLVRRTSAGTNILGQILIIYGTGAPLLMILAGADLLRLPLQAALLAALAGLAYVAAYVGLFRAFALAPARVVSPILGAYPLFTMLMAALTGAETTLADWLAVTAVVAGIAAVALLAAPEDRSTGSLAPALLWAALGSAGFAAAFALGQAASVGDLSLAAGSITRVTALVVILILLAVQRPSLAPMRANWRLLVGMGLLDTAALALVMLAGGRPHAEYAAVAASLFGIVTILMAWVFLREKVRPAQWLGIALVFGGIGWLAL